MNIHIFSSKKSYFKVMFLVFFILYVFGFSIIFSNIFSDIDTDSRFNITSSNVHTYELQNITINYNFSHQSRNISLTFKSQLENINQRNDYDQEIIIELLIETRSGIFVQRELFECEKECSVDFELEKIILEEYEFTFRIIGEKEIREFIYVYEFDFSFFQPQHYEFILQDSYLLKEEDFKDSFEIDFIINSTIDEEITYIAEILSYDLQQIGNTQQFMCLGVCEKQLLLQPPFLLSTYVLRVYSILGDREYEFELIFEDNLTQLQEPLESQEIIINQTLASIELEQSFGILNSRGRVQNSSVHIRFDEEDLDEQHFLREELFSTFQSQEEIQDREVMQNRADIDFIFNSGPVRNISVRGARLEEILIGYEELSLMQVSRYGFNTNNAFAIDPHFNEEITEFEVTFTATADSIFKCVDYDFVHQECFGDFEFLMYTNRGEEYTITLDPEDPLFLQVDNSVFGTNNESYIQGAEVFIGGSQIWDFEENIIIEITSPSNSLLSIVETQTNLQGDFLTSITLDDYAHLGEYSLFAYQESNSSINASSEFIVEVRIPELLGLNSFYSVNQRVVVEGIHWVKEETLEIEILENFGDEEIIFSDTLVTSSLGEFEFDFRFEDILTDVLLVKTGEYIIRIRELINSSYNVSSKFKVVFKPDFTTPSNALELINQSDEDTFTLGGVEESEQLEINFPPTLVDDEQIEIDSIELQLEYFTEGPATRSVEWLNPLSLEFELICIVPESSILTTFTCDLTEQIQEYESFNDVVIRLVENGGVSENWFIDFVYMTRTFSQNNSSSDVHLSLSRKINRVNDTSMEMVLELQNKNSIPTPEDKSIFVYVFASEYYALEDLLISEGEYFTTFTTSNVISAFGVEGVLHTIEFAPSLILQGVFLGFHGNINSTNSANISFLFSTNPEFFQSAHIYYIGFDPVLTQR